KGEINGFFDCNLVAIGEDTARHVLADNHGRLGAASTDGADLAQDIGYREELHGAGKELALEIGAQAIAHDRDLQPVGYPGEAPDLVAREELCLIDEDAIDLGFLVEVPDRLVEVIAGGVEF